MKHFTAYAGGTAQNSPGWAGIGLILRTDKGQEWEYAEPIGITTAEQAHYQAAIQAISHTLEKGGRSLTLCLCHPGIAKTLSLRSGVASPQVAPLYEHALRLGRSLSISYRTTSPQENLRCMDLAHQALLKNEEYSGENAANCEKRQAIQQSAGGVVYKKEGNLIKVCLISKSRGRVWALPKGRVNPGETWEQTAVREVLEETGHLATISEHINQIDYFFYWKGNNTYYYKLVSFYLMPLVTENFAPRDDEADDVAWLTIGDAMQRLYYQSEKSILRQARRILKTAGA